MRSGRGMRRAVVGGVLLALTVSACGGDDTGGTAGPPDSTGPETGPESPGDGAEAEEATLEVIWMGWDAEQVDPLMAAFEDANPHITLEYERIPFGEIFQTIEVRLSARNESPDVYIVDGPLTASYAAGGHLMNLSEAFEEEMPRFTQAAIDQGSWEGELYSAPFVSSMALMYYNRSLFEQAGIEPPSANPDDRWTWDQVLEAGLAIREVEGNPWGLVIEQTDGPYQLLPLPESKGATVISEDGLTASGYVDSPEFIEAIEFYQDLFEQEVTPAVYELSLGQELFGTGQAGMMIGGTWGVQQLQNDYPDIDWGAAPHPYFADGEPATPTGSWHVGVNPRTDDEAAALTFAKWLSSNEAGEVFFGLRPYVPVQQELFESVIPDNDAWDIIEYELQNTAVPRPKTPGYRQYEDILRQAFRNIDTGANVEQTLTEAAQEIDSQLEQFR